jgi:hypothetical protein
MSIHVVDSWTDDDIDLLEKACRASGVNLPKDPREDPNWTDEECEPVRNACKVQANELGRFLHDARDSISGRSIVEEEERKYNKYIEFYRRFGGQDQIG